MKFDLVLGHRSVIDWKDSVCFGSMGCNFISFMMDTRLMRVRQGKMASIPQIFIPVN